MKKLFGLILCIVIFSSCSNEEEIVSNNDINQVFKRIEFNYKGKFYSSAYYEQKDSIFILDSETQRIYNQLQVNQNKLIHVDENNMVTYFDSESEYLEIEKSRPQLRTTDLTPYMTVVVRLYHNYSVFDTAVYPTTSMLIERTYLLRSVTRSGYDQIILASYPDLRIYNHNDNISLANVSLTIGNMRPDSNYRGEAALLMYEHINYEGEWCAGYAAVAWNDLINPMKLGEEKSESTKVTVKAIKKWNGDSFNDIISSLKIRLTYTDMNKKVPIEAVNSNRESSSRQEFDGEEMQESSRG